jgi:hypothetical protein
MLMLAPSSLYYITRKILRKLDEKEFEELSEELKQKVFVNEKEKNPIRCRICKNKITTVEHMIEMGGKHQHTFKNPSGLVFEIGLFSAASGCITLGTPTLDFTWFSGYAWNLALCSQCFGHLGWFYQSVDSSFFGLILENLIEESTTH